ncbi:fam-a protein [Plasmodium vinckei]|uniref:Fam-a protein n=1 Tax=Plasmodium vinckei TaxID=5860 RepID=A0A6V7TAJ2_PLAVN|nr:fam-a protein [Plasmodium vinckei]
MNKGYINIALALLSVAGYMQNIAFASNFSATTNSSNEKGKQELPIDPEEAKQAANVMAEALALAQKHAEHTNDYELYSSQIEGSALHFKKVNNTDIGKLEFTIPNPDNYVDIVNMLWNPNNAKNFDDLFIKGSLSRIYNKNLVIIQQRYKGTIWTRYYNALANKVELSEDETAIVYASSDMNNHDGVKGKEYVNPIVKSANSFKPDIDSEEDIRDGKLYIMYINLVAFFIKKEDDCVKITHINSVDMNFSPKAIDDLIKKMKADKILNIVKLRDIFKK